MAGAASHIDLFDHKTGSRKSFTDRPPNFGEKVEAFQNGLGSVDEIAFRVQTLWPIRKKNAQRRRGRSGVLC